MRLDRTLSLSFLRSTAGPQPTRNHLNVTANSRSLFANNATTISAVSKSSSSASSSSVSLAAALVAASSSLSPLLWALLPAQFGVDPSTSSGQTTAATLSRSQSQLPLASDGSSSELASSLQQRVQSVRLPAGTVLQLRDLQALLALAAASGSSLPGTAASTTAGYGTGVGVGSGYSMLRYPCSATDFQDYYFGTSRANTSKPSNNNRLSTHAPLGSAFNMNNTSSVVSAVSAFAAEEVVTRSLTHSFTTIVPVISSPDISNYT